MSENKVFCEKCMEKYCLVSTDNTCEMIRIYLNAKEKQDLTPFGEIKLKDYQEDYVKKTKDRLLNTPPSTESLREVSEAITNFRIFKWRHDKTPECKNLFKEENDE